MLPVLGLLRTYPCPHAIAGLCARPNCFYSHKKSEIQQAKKKIGLETIEPSTNLNDETVPQDNFHEKESIQPGSSKEANVKRKPEAAPVVVTGSSKERETSDKCSSESASKPHKVNKEDGSSVKRKHSQDSSHQVETTHDNVKRQRKTVQTSDASKNNDVPNDKQPGAKQLTKVTNTTTSKEQNKREHGVVRKQAREDKTSSQNGFSKERSVVKKVVEEEFVDEADDPTSDFMLPESGGGESGDDDDPDQIALECLQMFNSYKPDSVERRPSISASKEEPSLPKEEIPRTKRVAHTGVRDTAVVSKAQPPSKPKQSATETMMRRYEHAKQHGLVVNTGQKTPSRPSTDGKKRIAHVANVSGLMKPASTPSGQPPMTAGSSTISTTAQTIGKGEARQAHKPKLPETVFPPPKIPWESIRTSKIPVVVRQKILDQLFQECRKIYDQPEDAAQRALAEEKELSTRCSAKPVYFCSGTNAISRLRKEANNGTTSGSSKAGAISHLSVIAGASGARNSWSIESVKKMAWPPPGPLLYIGLTRYLLTEEELVSNCFPRKSPLGGGRAVITYSSTAKPKVDLNAQPFLRICDRCNKSYKVDKEGMPVVREKCVFHHGRKFKRKVNGIIEGRYTCCDGDVSAEGCSLSDYHVSAHCTNQLRGFVTAVKEQGDENSMGSDPWDIIALDCEMIYTSHGNELARVTIVGYNQEIVYDEFVKPIHPVLDYNTKFSGITEAMLNSTSITLTDVQAVLLTRLRPNTIIVGHSLENDLLALKLIHGTVVDTSVLFPHRLGPPLKRALRNLSTECLGKIIQMGEGGHDSAEDARSALELALWKLKEDSKLQDCFTRTSSMP